MKCVNFISLFSVVVMLMSSCNSDKKIDEKTIKKAEEKKQEIIHQISSPTKTGSSLPVLFTNKKDEVFLSWVTKVNDSITQFNYSCLVDTNWKTAKEIIKGVDWFVNWADYPSISENNGNLIAHFLKRSSKEKYSYDVKLNVLPKEKTKWNTNLPLHTDGTFTEHGFVTMLPYRDNSFFITWLDGRSMDENNEGVNGAMNIRAAAISSEGAVSNDILLDGRTCSCCQTTAAITDNGPVVLYRDRSADEIRDIAITRMVQGKWTKPKPIHNDGWKINGCPVNGPKIDVIGNDLAVAWFTAVNDEPKVKLVFSKNGGESFGDAILINEFKAMGRVDVVMLDPENAVVSWMETKGETSYLKALKVNMSGVKSKPIIVSQMTDSRKTGFPQMERVGDKIFFAWTIIETGENLNIKTAFISSKSF